MNQNPAHLNSVFRPSEGIDKMAEAALNGARRYLFWVGYDGSKFLEMAKGNTGYGVVDLLRRCLEYALPVASPDDIKLAPSSRLVVLSACKGFTFLGMIPT